MEINDYKRLLRDANYTDKHINEMFNKGSEVFIIQHGWIVLGGLIGTCTDKYGGISGQHFYYANSLCTRTDPKGLGVPSMHSDTRDFADLMTELTTTTQQLILALITSAHDHPLRPRIVIPTHHISRYHNTMDNSKLFELSWHGPLTMDMGQHIADKLPGDCD